MGVKRLKIKDDLNYRKGYTWKACSYCEHYLGSFDIAKDGDFNIAEPRCKIIGLKPGRLYRINPGHVCDKYEYTSPYREEFIASQAAQPKEDYEPYGPEWEKEMMKLDKKALIAMLKAKGQGDNVYQNFSTDKLLKDIEFLAQRAKYAGCAYLSKERETGNSSNAIVALAYLGEPVEHLPFDNSDLSACTRMFEKLPDHRKTKIVLDAMEQARMAVNG